MPYGTILTDVIQSSTAGTAPVFKDGNSVETGTLCRAWVNFNGTGTVAIRSSFNVSSITDNGTGDYTVNFTTAIVDANYSCVSSASAADANNDGGYVGIKNGTTPTTTAVRLITDGRTTGEYDPAIVSVAIFR